MKKVIQKHKDKITLVAIFILVFFVCRGKIAFDEFSEASSKSFLREFQRSSHSYARPLVPVSTKDRLESIAHSLAGNYISVCKELPKKIIKERVCDMNCDDYNCEKKAFLSTYDEDEWGSKIFFESDDKEFRTISLGKDKIRSDDDIYHYFDLVKGSSGFVENKKGNFVIQLF